jgi:hypothetical protein
MPLAHSPYGKKEKSQKERRGLENTDDAHKEGGELGRSH